MMKIWHGACQNKSGITTTGKPEKPYTVSVDVYAHLYLTRQRIDHTLDIDWANEKG